MNTKVIILAAGVGSRLAPISTTIPKSLTKVAGKEIVDYQISGYLNAGINEKDITVVAGYKSEMMVDFFKTNYPQVSVLENKDYNKTNNMYSLYMALNELAKEDFDVLFINNADCTYDLEIINDLLESSAKNAIAAEVGVFNDESMKLVADSSSGKLQDIAKTITEDKAFGLSIDLYKISKDAVNSLHTIVKRYIEKDKDLNQWTEVAFPELFSKEDFVAHDIKGGRWFEIDNLEDLLNADKLFSDFDPTKKDAFILDIDGTLFIGDEPIQPAVDWVTNNSTQEFYFLTNNTSRVPSEYVKKLAKGGIKTDEEHITTPLYALSDYIKDNDFTSVYLVANNQVTEYMKSVHPNVSFEYDFENNEVVVLTYDTEINYEKLKNVCVLLNNKSVEYVATHSDVFCPTPLGGVPDIGSYIQLIEAVTSKHPYTYFGKPDANLVKPLIKKYSADKLAVAGDRLYTDKKLADNADIDFICVLSGETDRAALAVEDVGKYPAIVVKNLGEL